MSSQWEVGAPSSGPPGTLPMLTILSGRGGAWTGRTMARTTPMKHSPGSPGWAHIRVGQGLFLTWLFPSFQDVHRLKHRSVRRAGRGHSKVTNSAGTGQLALRRRLWQGQQQGLGATPFSGARWGFQRDCWAWVPLSIGSTDWDGERACGSRGGGDFAEGRIGVCSCSLASWVQRTDSRSSAHPCPFLLYWIGPPSAAKP